MAKSRKAKETPIVGADIRRHHPRFFEICPTDTNYAMIGRKIYNILKNYDFLSEYGDKKELAITLTLYLEDVVSFGGTWRAFNYMCQRLYGRDLPFYNHELVSTIGDKETVEYVPDEVNLEDISFLLWKKIQQMQEDKFINPENPGIMLAAFEIYMLLLDLFEEAPINPAFELLYTIPIKDEYERFCFYRDYMQWIFRDNYLLARPDAENLITHFEKEMRSILDGAEDGLAQYSANVNSIFLYPCGPLALYPHQWLAAMMATSDIVIEENKADIPRLANLKYKVYAPYNIASISKDCILAYDVYDQKVKVSKDSFNIQLIDTESKSFHSALVKFNENAWFINGICSFSYTTIDMRDFRDSIQRMKYGRDIGENETAGTLKSLTKAIGGRRYGFFDSALAYVHKIIPADEIANPSPELKKNLEMADDKDPVFVYVLDDGTTFLSPLLAKVIPAKENPYYVKSDTEQKDILSILLDNEDGGVPPELIDFLIKKKWLKNGYLNSIHGMARGKKLLQDNMDFICRIFRNNSYYAKKTQVIDL